MTSKICFFKFQQIQNQQKTYLISLFFSIHERICCNSIHSIKYSTTLRRTYVLQETLLKSAEQNTALIQLILHGSQITTPLRRRPSTSYVTYFTLSRRAATRLRISQTIVCFENCAININGSCEIFYACVVFTVRMNTRYNTVFGCCFCNGKKVGQPSLFVFATRSLPLSKDPEQAFKFISLSADTFFII